MTISLCHKNVHTATNHSCHNCLVQQVLELFLYVTSGNLPRVTSSLGLLLFFHSPHRSPAMHYWLRPIGSGQLVFQNFASIFIFIQIFQIDFSTLPFILSASNYFRYILSRRNEHFSISMML